MSKDTYSLDDIRFCFGEKAVADLRQQIIFEFLQKVVKKGGVLLSYGWTDDQLKAFIEKMEGGE